MPEMRTQKLSSNLYTFCIGRENCAAKRMQEMRSKIYDLGKEDWAIVIK
ncbi:MAG: hypothetical protein BWY69_00015 [Planctomycetes bacterium ADurb.Bin401]|nr:MAG: hypothetical protein BWY69_00015 [Planctomycetes bacterium ADurb.Bin401]